MRASITPSGKNIVWEKIIIQAYCYHWWFGTISWINLSFSKQKVAWLSANHFYTKDALHYHWTDYMLFCPIFALFSVLVSTSALILEGMIIHSFEHYITCYYFMYLHIIHFLVLFIFGLTVLLLHSFLFATNFSFSSFCFIAASS